VIYKISEITDEDGKFLPTMKLSHGKVTFPGRKQVFRVRDARGRFVRDVLGLESETRAGQRLLRKVIDRGTVVYRIPSLEASRAYVKKNLKQFPQAMLDIHSTYAYPVVISKKLASLRRGLARQLAMRQ
jgi:nicotinate phosphoribosyltransferase